MIIFNNLPVELAEHSEELIDWLKKIAQLHSSRVNSLSYSFLDNAAIREMNVKHLNHDYATDIITFGYEEGRRISGEIFIGEEVVRVNALDHSVTSFDEFCRVIVHGLLHLIGFDDHSEQDKLKMREEEEKSLILRPEILKHQSS